MFKQCIPCVISAVLCATTGMAVAQNDAVADAAPSYTAPESYAPNWSDEGIAQIATQLTGTWKSANPVEGDDVYIAMSVAPAPVVGMSDTLYIESVRSNAAWAPYRRAFFQLYRYKGEIRLRTYDFAIGATAEGVFDGMWAATELFPVINAHDLVATLDVELEASTNGFTGATPYPYPTGVAGAVEMTSSVTLDGDTLTVADRGFDAQGNVVWGSDADSAIAFDRSKSFLEVTRRDDGMVILDYAGERGIEPQDGDELHVHYDGYLMDGKVFDSSYARNQPFVFTYPPLTRAITGWGIGMEGFAMGTHRKMLIPGYLAYGERGNPRANIPPNSMLAFNATMAHINHVEAQAVEPAMTETDSHEGHNHD